MIFIIVQELAIYPTVYIFEARHPLFLDNAGVQI